jgi:hypothetical protein
MIKTGRQTNRHNAACVPIFNVTLLYTQKTTGLISRARDLIILCKQVKLSDNRLFSICTESSNYNLLPMLDVTIFKMFPNMGLCCTL